MRIFRILCLSTLSLFTTVLFAQPDIRKQWQTRLITVADGETINLDEGTFVMDATLSMEGKKNITIKGKGIDKTIISFKGQKSGAEGLRVSNCTNITLEDFSVEDAKGDGVKTMNVNGITFRNIRAMWTGKPDKNNGSYALYPVLCENVLIENCIARGASDAGIYVGQSKDIIVRNNKAYENVAGIEIENSLNAEVYDNETYNNTGGLLVFDLPDLKLKRGGHCKLYRNTIRDNNLPNFAPKGNIVGKVPLGTGILLLACTNVEIYENQILNNRTTPTGIISYYMTENPIKDSTYYPYPTSVYIHDNVYSKPRKKATMRGRMGKMYRFKLKFGKDVPDIVYDGILDDKVPNGKFNYSDNKRICIRNNKGASYANLDAANGFKNISRDSAPMDCNPSTTASVQ
ncbi:parallel beta-helix domain-containing protein [Pollutibacter soli]|uniref:parallel beta-helix domain-containing protein n=1 Tax=Pollutibacter soli TaxID=3034157 RepID=UPI0030140FE6